MSRDLEDYALIGDTQSAALVGRDGSIDWLCLPRFDSAACFAALLGGPEHGRWLLAPTTEVIRTVRRYRPDSLVLETELHTRDGVVRIVDCMPVRAAYPDLVRVVEGISGRVAMRMELVVRFDYGQIVPWVRTTDGRLQAVAGAEALVLTTAIELRGDHAKTVGEFTVASHDRVPFTLRWHPSYETPGEPADPLSAIEATEVWWRTWVARCNAPGLDRAAVVRSLITLKALCFAPTGGIIAAPTTSLPEILGGQRNWDYRYCWLRDTTFTLYAFTHCGYQREAAAWRDWLHRAVAGDPAKLRVVYGVAGERRLDDHVIEELPGYAGSSPVRIGNAASGQLQLDVYGEVADALHQARRIGLAPNPATWEFERLMFEWLEAGWAKPDQGLWEIRSAARHYTHSKVMAWVAFDRAVKGVEQQQLDGPVERWRAVRDEIHRDVCTRGYDAELASFTQSYGSQVIDASLLLIPAVGFLPASDPRIQGTISAVERGLLRGGLVARYVTHDGDNADGQPGREGAFLACSCWLVDAYVLAGRHDDARALFDRVLALRNDVGLLSEEYDPDAERLVGNFPQAFSHVALVNSARNLAGAGPAHHRTGT
ncbi:MAG TPA: glycoside hydrolase family 15 protein [Kofleriaceae bacterium]|jgi:GH15 family glucan-1,4-alpha-glucosidase|nr:glycoside hydrolase family 15 protein [Kofleriaceae bacterium]